MFPAYNAAVNCVSPNHSARFHLSKTPYLPGHTCSLSLMNKVWRGFSLGGKVTANFEGRTSDFALAAKYRRPIKKKQGAETFEAMAFLTSGTLKAWYTRNIAYHTTLTSGLEVNPGARKAVGSFGYRYVFGSRMMGPQLVGSVNSNMEFKQALQIPVMENMIFRIHGQMNHMNQNVQRGVFPNIFGISLIIQSS